MTTRETEPPSWLLYVGPDSGGTTFTGNTVDGTANRAFVGVESVWDGDSSLSHLNDAKDNPPIPIRFKGNLRNPRVRLCGTRVEMALWKTSPSPVILFTARNKTSSCCVCGCGSCRKRKTAGRRSVETLKASTYLATPVKGVKGNDYSELFSYP